MFQNVEQTRRWNGSGREPDIFKTRTYDRLESSLWSRYAGVGRRLNQYGFKAGFLNGQRDKTVSTPDIDKGVPGGYFFNISRMTLFLCWNHQESASICLSGSCCFEE